MSFGLALRGVRHAPCIEPWLGWRLASGVLGHRSSVIGYRSYVETRDIYSDGQLTTEN